MPDYSCQQCGNSFEGFPGNANKFCSRPCYWESKRHKKERECPTCHSVYLAVLSKGGDFCSRKCFNKYKSQNSVDVPCLTCGKIVHRWKTSIHKSGNVYCSRKCATEAIKKPGWKETPSFKLNSNIRRAIGKALNGSKNGRHWETLAGYTLDQLKSHIECQFLPGMSWDNYSVTGWHIDHIIPKNVFNFSKPEHPDFKRCWSLDNLRPMWSVENIRKGNRITKPFQPYLALEGRA